MNSIEQHLVELIRLAETPLYSAFAWLRRQLHGALSLAAFLQMVDDLVRDDVIRLWLVDESGARTELYSTPSSLAAQYLSIPDIHESYDPFGLSVSLGTAADVHAEQPPAWVFDLDKNAETFTLRCAPQGCNEALVTLARLLPELVLETDFVGQGMITGRVIARRSI